MTRPRLFLRSRANTLLVVWREFGLIRLLRFVAGLCLRYDRLYRLAVYLQEYVPGGPDSRGITVVEGTPAMLARLRASAPRQSLPLPFYLDLTHRAKRFYMAFVDGQVASIAWVFTAGDRTHIALGLDEVEIAHVYTLTEFRNRGLFRIVSRRILSDLKAAGFRTAYAAVDFDNTASLRAHHAVGYRASAIIHLVRVLGYPHVILRKVPPSAVPLLGVTSSA